MKEAGIYEIIQKTRELKIGRMFISSTSLSRQYPVWDRAVS